MIRFPFQNCCCFQRTDERRPQRIYEEDSERSANKTHNIHIHKYYYVQVSNTIFKRHCIGVANVIHSVRLCSIFRCIDNLF